jgi:phenylalanyl-tRNA synthetase beta chain
VGVVRAAGGELLRAVEVFDVYEGEQAGEGRRSIAMHLTCRARDRTLTDEEVNERIERVLDEARSRVGAASRA